MHIPHLLPLLTIPMQTILCGTQITVVDCSHRLKVGQYRLILLGRAVVQTCTCREYIHVIVLATPPYHNPSITTSCWHQYVQTSTVLGLQLCLG